MIKKDFGSIVANKRKETQTVSTTTGSSPV